MLSIRKKFNLIRTIPFRRNSTVENSKPKLTDVYQIKSRKMGPPDIEKLIDRTKFTNPNVELGIYHKEKYSEEYFNETRKPIPLSPRLGPFEINNPQFENKTYHWCSCGMSKSQPFCDGSHKGTVYKPLSFKLAEKCDQMLLCGCKLTQSAPFCDGKTCVNLRQSEDEQLKKTIIQLDKEIK